MKSLVLYHANCNDGFGAAFAAWAKLGDAAEYVPVQYGQVNTVEDLASKFGELAGRDIYLLDFSFPRPVLDWLLDNANRFVWLDHHKTAFELWDATVWMERQDGLQQWLGTGLKHTIHLNNFKSGAMLAWQFFHPEKDVPLLIKMIDDRDRWQFKIDGSRELHAGLGAGYPMSFEDWNLLVPSGSSDWGKNLGNLVACGATVLRAYDEQINHSAAKANQCTIRQGDWSVQGLAVNNSLHISETGNKLAAKSGTFGLIWYYDGKLDQAICSLRSIGGYDVSAIAKRFGGGGHRNAAGFKVPMEILMGWLRKE